jgi:hypothetical protein
MGNLNNSNERPTPRRQVINRYSYRMLQLHELASYVQKHGLSAAARHYGLGYSVVRRRIQALQLPLPIGRRVNPALAARNAHIRIARMTGLTLGQVGIPYNLGRERVRQILKATGGDPIKEASKAGVKVGESSSSSLRRKVR